MKNRTWWILGGYIAATIVACGGGGDSKDAPDDEGGGSGGAPASAGTHFGTAGSRTTGEGGEGGSAEAGAPSATGGSGTGAPVCEPGATRLCVGPGACMGAQECRSGAWSACDCGDGKGGTGGSNPGTGGAPSGGSGGTPSSTSGAGGEEPTSGGSGGDGGTPSAGSGGDGPVSGGSGGAGGENTGGGGAAPGGICSANEYDCNGSTLYVCAASRDDWDYVDTCVTAGLCDEGQGRCNTPVCAVGAKSCNGNDVRVCNPARTDYVVDHTCSGTNVECDPLVSDCLGPVLDFGACTGDGDRWIHHTENSFNIQGYVYEATDELGSSVDTVTTCGRAIRASGIVAAKEEDVWGAEVGIRVCELDNGGNTFNLEDCTLPGDHGALIGVRFTLCPSQGTYPGPLHVVFPENNGAGAYYRIENPARGQTYTVRMTDSGVRVWWDAEQPSDPKKVTAIGWNVPSGEFDEDFNLCITDIELLGTL